MRTDTAFWHAYAAVYDLLWDNEFASAVAGCVEASMPAGVRVLEVGAGTGLLTARLLAAGVSVTATEPNVHMRERLQARLPELAVDDRTLGQVCAEGFDGVVVLSNVLHLVPDPRQAFEQIAAAACCGVVVVTPASGASLTKVARALRHHGSSRSYVARFLTMHAVLAPLSALAGVTATPFDDSFLSHASDVRTMGGVQTVASFVEAPVYARSGAVR